VHLKHHSMSHDLLYENGSLIVPFSPLGFNK